MNCEFPENTPATSYRYGCRCERCTAIAKAWSAEKKKRYAGICEVCGGRTYGGSKSPPTTCRDCLVARNHEAAKARIIDQIQGWTEAYGRPPGAMEWNPADARARGQHEKAERAEREGWPHTSTVQQLFGSWSEAIQAAGFTPRSPGYYGRDGEDDTHCHELRERYEAGESAYRLSKELGVAAETVAYRIRRVGGTMRTLREARALREGVSA